MVQDCQWLQAGPLETLYWKLAGVARDDLRISEVLDA